jgi:hypothetical protein
MFLYSTAYLTTLGLTQPIKWLPGAFRPGEKRPGSKSQRITVSLVSRSRRVKVYLSLPKHDFLGGKEGKR